VNWTVLLVLVAAFCPRPATAAASTESTWIRGMTISCQTYGPEWGSDGFGVELARLKELGTNWVAIHPYASIRADGTVRSRLDPNDPPQWLVRPIEEARRAGMQIMIKPHLAYWGSPFAWRGEINFERADERERFFETYRRWITDVARVTAAADAFVVGTELDALGNHEAAWRRVIADVRATTRAKLTYAANWDTYREIRFWDALDAVGVQAYFPLSAHDELSDERALRQAWEPILADLRGLQRRTGKPIVFTELGYARGLDAAREPWVGNVARGAARPEAELQQERLLRVALEMLAGEREWLRGAFLWKWFVGPAPRANYVLDRPAVHELLRAVWRPR